MIDDKLFKKSISFWNLKNDEFELLAHRENITYKVYDLKGSPFVLRFHRKNYSDFDEIESELLWLKNLIDFGMNVPEPILSINNRLIEKIQDQFITLLEWQNGLPLSIIDKTKNNTFRSLVYSNLGEALAELHLLSDKWVKPQNFNKRNWDINGLLGNIPIWDKFWKNPELTKDQSNKLFNLKKKYYSLFIKKENDLDYGLIHADAVRDNVLVENSGKVSLIDFDDSGYGFRLFDIATILLHYINEKDFLNIKKNIIDGYLKKRDLDFKYLNHFILFRSFTYIGWNISRINETNGHERNKKYIENTFNLIKTLEIEL